MPLPPCLHASMPTRRFCSMMMNQFLGGALSEITITPPCIYPPQNFDDGYVKWVDERMKLAPHQPSPPLAPPWPPGTDVAAAGEGAALVTVAAAVKAKLRREARRSKAGGSRRRQR